eukprot:jgi/Tetstr1/457966/TSEL_044479.t1
MCPGRFHGTRTQLVGTVRPSLKLAPGRLRGPHTQLVGAIKPQPLHHLVGVIKPSLRYVHRPPLRPASVGANGPPLHNVPGRLPGRDTQQLVGADMPPLHHSAPTARHCTMRASATSAARARN